LRSIRSGPVSRPDHSPAGPLRRAVRDGAPQPAERAGLQVDDVITAIDHATIDARRVWQWRAYLRDHAPGTEVALRIEREARRHAT
jgi:S1-C subfamily serine protease